MRPMDKDTVERVAGIAHIELSEEELERFTEELEKLFGLVNTLNDAPACDSLCFDPVGVHDVLREDVPVVYEDIENLLKDMSTYDGYVRGPKIV
ncbi:MAG: Asp-tRNA(Asn)/Glu-tRNA(Gln) amidotransferase subunit GatC [Methanomassiliicoccaceae archaeon]|nr:Asp-tRNA(Asn)/Glu-tRNA(Gln) amidotransferase subunit GatC [Methanomassiliicoccaceae archaeon]